MKIRQKILFMLVAVATAAFLLGFAWTVVADAKGGSSGGGSRSSGGGGGSKSSGGSKCCSSGSSKSSGTSKPKTASASKPSTGSKQQRAPVTKLVPPRPPTRISTPVVSRSGKRLPPRVSVPAGRSYERDRDFMYRNPSYADPYGSRYYGGYSSFSDSPLFYMWMFSMMDDDHSNDPLPPESDTEITTALLSYLQIIKSTQQMTGAK
jgi:hypothetical protein